MLSVVVTTFNRAEMIGAIIQNILSQSYSDMEVLVCDDASVDDIRKRVQCIDDKRIHYIRNEQNMGYVKNSLIGLKSSGRKYVTFRSDDDFMIDNEFFTEAIKILEQNEDLDFVFGRIKLVDQHGSYINNFDFKSLYTATEFFELWQKMRFNHQDYMSLSTIVFRREFLQQTHPFESICHNPSAIDVSTIFNAAMFAKKIGFIDVVASEWNLPGVNSLGGSSKDDLVKQVNDNLAAPLDIARCFKEHGMMLDIDELKLKQVLNERVLYSFDAIQSDYLHTNFEKDYIHVQNQLSFQQDIYIYGRGWTGLEIQRKLLAGGFKFRGFIDDFKTDFEDTISYTEFSKVIGRKSVIISNYKYKDIYSIYKKLSKVPNTTIIDLVSNEE